MMETAPPPGEGTPLDRGLRALCGIADYYRIGADPVQLARELALGACEANEGDLIRAANLLGMRARLLEKVTPERLATLPAPAIVRMGSGAFMVFGGRNPSGLWRLVDPVSHAVQEETLEDLARDIGGQALLVARKIGGAGVDPRQFGMRWFLPTIWRYRRPLGHVLAASLFVQIFALTTPLFFQVVVDKVLTHRGYETLFVLVGGLVAIGFFDVALQYAALTRSRTPPIGSTSNSGNACSRIFFACRFPISRPGRRGKRSHGCGNWRQSAASSPGRLYFRRSTFCSPSCSSAFSSPIRGR
jgi:ABC-type bacteriocin/lantibiotic exporter with double-glycine peptidase domain